jgi:Rieske Fe-S protein
VITQPSKGQFKCFTAVCTHQGCIVSGVSGGNINCECHGSAFSVADGSVVNGPATQPLAEEPIAVQGDAITLG